MLLVGLTGGIAGGKSFVRSVFDELGARTIDADIVAREVVAPGTPGLNRVIQEFGEEFLRPDGTLDRQRLAEVIFSDEKKRQRLEAILHPLIAREINGRIERFERNDPQAIVIVDAPLLLEVGMEGNFDRLVVVWAGEDTQLDRLMRRDGLPRHAAYRRIQAQLPMERKLALADYVIDNNGPPGKTREQTERVWELLKVQALVDSGS